MQSSAASDPDRYVVRLSGALAALLGRAEGTELPEDDLLGWLRGAGLITYQSPLLGGLLALPAVFEAEVLPRLEPAGGAGEPRGRDGLWPAARGDDQRGAARDEGFHRNGRASGVGQGERLPVGCEDVRSDRSARTPASAAAGAGARLSVG